MKTAGHSLSSQSWGDRQRERVLDDSGHSRARPRPLCQPTPCSPSLPRLPARDPGNLSSYPPAKWHSPPPSHSNFSYSQRGTCMSALLNQQIQSCRKSEPPAEVPKLGCTLDSPGESENTDGRLLPPGVLIYRPGVGKASQVTQTCSQS